MSGLSTKKRIKSTVASVARAVRTMARFEITPGLVNSRGVQEKSSGIQGWFSQPEYGYGLFLGFWEI